MRIKKAVILSAGYGKRLNPLTLTNPKPLLQIKNKTLLENWIANRGFKTIGMAKAAGYNPPFTLPFLRRNEVFIPIKRP